MAPGFYGDQEQQDTPAMAEETFLQDEDEEGFMLSDEEEEGDEYEDEEEREEEEEEEEEQVPCHRAPAPPRHCFGVGLM
jgi:hypothetical protein